MIISDRYKILYLSNPKCFSTSCRRALVKFGKVYWVPRDGIHPHTTAQEAKSLFDTTGRDWDAYFRVTMTRDPLKRLVSVFTWARCDTKNRYFWMKGWNEDDPMTFEQWFWQGKVLDRNTGRWTASKARYSVGVFARIGREISVHKIYDERTLEEFEADMSERIGVPISLPHENKTAGHREQEMTYFTPDMLAQVQRDFEYEYSVMGFTVPPYQPAGFSDGA